VGGAVLNPEYAASIQADGYGKDANDYAVGYMWGTTGLLYNTRYVDKEDVTSWSSLWQPKFAGKLLVKDAFRDVYSPLLMYENYESILSGEISRDSLMYDATDSSIAKVEVLLKKMKQNVAGWEADFGKEIMTKEKAWLNLTWSGDAVWAIEEAADVDVELDYTVPKEGSIVWFDGWVIPRYAKNKKAAVYFIDFMCKPENAIRNMEEIGYVSVIGTPEILEYVEESAIEAGFEEPLDLSYFFEGADSVVANPVLYHDRSVIERCTMMHDSGSRTEQLLEMWTRVKGDNLNNSMVVFILIVFGALLVVGLVRRSRKRRHRRRL
jgi:spermidine/putrescine transport system substrate-binding protein